MYSYNTLIYFYSGNFGTGNSIYIYLLNGQMQQKKIVGNCAMRRGAAFMARERKIKVVIVGDKRQTAHGMLTTPHPLLFSPLVRLPPHSVPVDPLHPNCTQKNGMQVRVAASEHKRWP